MVVLLDEAMAPKQRLSDVLASFPGGQLFQSAEEVEAFLRAEREAWDS